GVFRRWPAGRYCCARDGRTPVRPLLMAVVSGCARPRLRFHVSRFARYASRSHAPTLPRSRGFTLVEILVAIGILALVLAAIFSSWTAILRASKTGLDAAAAVQRSR